LANQSFIGLFSFLFFFLKQKEEEEEEGKGVAYLCREKSKKVDVVSKIYLIPLLGRRFILTMLVDPK
jgi:hypothetical protein